MSEQQEGKMPRENHNTREAKDDEQPVRWPREGEFMPDRPLAEAVTVQIAAVAQLMRWCGNFRAQPRLRNALDQLEIARDLLRTERHY